MSPAKAARTSWSSRRRRARRTGRPLAGAVATRLAMVLVPALVLASTACDAEYQAFLGGIPQPATNPDETAYVYLGIDGMSRRAFDEARARGAFAGWSDADLVTPFPGTSDYSWTRTLRAGSLHGYELQYFDPVANRMQTDGLEGTADHLLREGIVDTLPCYGRFDFLGDGATWQARSYLDPLSTLPGTLDELFDTIAGRARTKRQILAYVITADIASHTQGFEPAVSVLVELDRRIREFKASQARPFVFTLFADHGNAHLASTLIQARDVLTATGVVPADTLPDAPAADGLPRAVPVVHVRVSYVALHTRAGDAPEVAARTSRSPYVDLAVAPLDKPNGVYGVWRDGTRNTFRRLPDGSVVVDEPAAWDWLGADLKALATPDGHTAWLGDREAFEATRASRYPDLFYRVATAFTHPAADMPADVLWSLPDDVASIGFEIPAATSIRANDGFHGSLSRAATLSVLATDGGALPSAVRSDDLADLYPALRGAAD